MRTLVIGDAHIGNIYADTIALSEILRLGLRRRPGQVVFIGDVIDGAFKYGTQIFRQSSIRPVDVQRIMFREVVLRPLSRYGGRMVFVRGNHDTNFVEDFLRPALPRGGDVVYSNEYMDDDDTLYVHYILKGARGSYATTITPMLANLALSMARSRGARRLVSGHVHRAPIHLRLSGVELVVPSSLLRFSDAYDTLYDECGVLLDGWGTEFICVEKPPIDRVLARNISLIDKALRELLGEEGDIYR